MMWFPIQFCRLHLSTTQVPGHFLFIFIDMNLRNLIRKLICENINDEPLSIGDNPDRFLRDLEHQQFRNEPFDYGAVNSESPSPELSKIIDAIEKGFLQIKKEYVLLKNKGSQAKILLVRVYENNWVVVGTISQRNKFPAYDFMPQGVYSSIFFPPNKSQDAFAFARQEKENLLKKGFHI